MSLSSSPETKMTSLKRGEGCVKILFDMGYDSVGAIVLVLHQQTHQCISSNDGNAAPSLILSPSSSFDFYLGLVALSFSLLPSTHIV